MANNCIECAAVARRGHGAGKLCPSGARQCYDDRVTYGCRKNLNPMVEMPLTVESVGAWLKRDCVGFESLKG